MKEGLLIGGSVVVAGIFVGVVAYKLAKNPNLLKNTKKQIFKVAADAKKAFTEGFKGASSKVATA